TARQRDSETARQRDSETARQRDSETNSLYLNKLDTSHDNSQVNIPGLTRKMQLVELDIFKAFKAICEKHNLRYFAIGGTCIGAVRHHGFIPWDDDMDVAMPYEDYVKFFEVAGTELPENLKMWDLSSRKHFPLLFSKIYNINTTFIEADNLPYKENYAGVFIDIFPIYGMPSGKLRQKIFIFIVRMLRKCDLILRFKLHETFKKKIFLFMLRNKPFYYFLILTKKFLSKYKHFDSSDKIIFPWRPLPGEPQGKYYKGVFYYEDFKNFPEVPFEDTTMRVPVGYDRYLTMDFGDYMQLPPEEERISSHSQGGIIDFERSYKYYQERLN
ncbi:MAG: LicD family protein, partial [Synergistaceae bacterium]|nr:LicD family protein [Synergistaceae bacterium]